ncbi:MAG: GGDEF domain-containing protein [Pseudohongiellaceae bacterium]
MYRGNMASTDEKFGLSQWRGEFVDAELEEDFRQHAAESSAHDLRLALWAWIALLILLSALDFRLFGFTSSEFFVIASRVLLITGLVALLYRSRINPRLATSGFAVTALEMGGFFSFFLLYFSHPGTIIYTIVISLLMLIAVFVVIPNRVVPATVAALFASIGTMYCAYLLDAAEVTYMYLLAFLSSSCALGYLAARRQHLTQRRQFALLRETEIINRRLNAEIEQRKLLEKELKQQAITDPLTGLYNRRHFESLFDHELRRAARKKSPLCLCLIDLDYFKRVNDEHGHETGDRVLQHAAKLFVDSLRKTDVVGRIGGEEFVLLLPDSEFDSARLLIERLRHGLAVEHLQIGDVAIGVTATFAVTKVNPEQDTLLTAMRAADKALYEGKAAGRNCVVLAAS